MLEFVLLAAAGACLLAGLQSVLAARARPSFVIDVVFGLACLLMAVFNVTTVLMASAEDVPTWVGAYRIHSSANIAVMMLLVVLAVRLARWHAPGVVWTLAALHLCMLALVWVRPFGVGYDHIDGLTRVGLPWGDTSAQAVGQRSSVARWGLVLFLLSTLTIVFSATRLLRLPRARPLLIGLALFLGAALYDFVFAAGINPLPVDELGFLFLILGMGLTRHAEVREIEESSHLAKERLAEKEFRLQEAERIARAGHWLWDIDTDRVVWSDQIHRIFGLTPDTLGTTFDAFLGWVHEDDRDFVMRQVAAAVKADEPYRLELRVVRPDGEVRWVYEEAEVTRRGDGTASSMLGVVMDVTERKLLEAQLRQSQKMEALGQVTGGVAHDFNNVLTVIRGQLQLALEEGVPLRGVEARLHRALKTADRGASLTSRLLAFSRKETLDPRPLSLRELVDGARDALRQCAGPGVSIDFQVAPDLWLIRSDRTQLEQSLVNLVINAHDALPSGGRVSIRCRNLAKPRLVDDRRRLEAGDFVVLEVEDDGVGMDEETRRRAMDPFFTTKGLGQGTGLGLSTVQGFVTQLGGDMEVWSRPDRGTRITLYLPRAAGGQAEDTPVPSVVEPRDEASERVLLVEDEDEVRAVVHDMLEHLGFRVVAVRGPAEALSAMEGYPDLNAVLTDVDLNASVTGIELGWMIQEMRPSARVIHMSGFLGRALEQLVGPEPPPILCKPFELRALAVAMSRDGASGNG